MPPPRYAEAMFVKRFGGLKQVPHDAKVVFFPGCYINYYDPQVGLDFVAVMQRNGYEVVVPDGLRCCGVPLMSNGYLDEAARSGEHNLRILGRWTDEGYPVVACCPSCALMLKREYQELLDLEASHRVAGHIHDAGEFLLGLYDEGKLDTGFTPMSGRFIYHAPCHLRAQGIGRPGLELLRLLPGVEVRDADAGCCGLAGSYGFKKDKAAIARAVGAELFRKIADHGADAAVSECGTCRLQIARGTGVPVRHPVSILRQAYG
jgi:glycerol-3-phosphate dehydrogenase subunit C